MSFQRFLLISAVAAGSALVALADDGKSDSHQTSTSTPSTTPTVTRDIISAPVTLSATETARVIVANTAAAATSTSTAPSCAGSIAFLASGTAPPTTTPTNFMLGAGQFAFADLTYAKSGISISPGEVIGEVHLTINVGSKAPCTLQTSLVVFDSTTGAAHVVVSGAGNSQGGPIPLLAFGGR